jgi:hypothetical protein
LNILLLLVAEEAVLLVAEAAQAVIGHQLQANQQVVVAY